ncbi:MAG: metallophosphoesterase family protein [Gaiellaceae bacterium]
MDIASVPLRIAQVSDIHCGTGSFSNETMQSILDRIARMEPDIVVIAGDLSTDGYDWEFQEALGWIEQIPFPMVVIPGNHDGRNVGYLHFERYFGPRQSRYRQAFDGTRAERMQATGFTIVGVDSSEPDINDGAVGLERYGWIRDQFDEPDDIRIFVVHHHLVSIPGTGRERNIVTDAGDLLAHLISVDVDLVLSGHKHVPFFWGLNGMLICNSGTATTKRVRGLVPPSWNEIIVDASTIKVYVHYEDGRRELSVIFSRKTRALTREAFYLTDAYRASNPVFVL